MRECKNKGKEGREGKEESKEKRDTFSHIEQKF